MVVSNKKQLRIDSFRLYLITNGIEFSEHANGHFQIFQQGERAMDVWATTYKFITADGNKYVGAHLIWARLESIVNKRGV